MTRNTKLYRVPSARQELVYRTLTLNELTFLENITNEYYKHENACRLALVEGTVYDLEFAVINDIGEQILKSSRSIMTNSELFNVTVQDFRMRLKEDVWTNMIITILNIVPGTTYEHLSNLTYADLIELTCLAEKMSNKKLLNTATLPESIDPDPSGPQYMPDEHEGLSLQDKMSADKKWYKED